MVLAMVCAPTPGTCLLKRGMTEIGAVAITASGVSRAFWMTVTSVTIWAGIFFLIGFMVSYMTVRSWADYSYVMPAGAFGYAILTLLAVLFLHENVTPKRWVGVLLICLACCWFGQTSADHRNAAMQKVRHERGTMILLQC